MKLHFKVLAAVVALLWLPLSSHCTLEQLSGLEVLACASDHTDHKPVPHQDNDCQNDACASVESGSYRIEDRLAYIPSQHLLIHLPSVLTSVPDMPPVSEQPAFPPPGLSAHWQFAFRTAAPPRAPSSVS